MEGQASISPEILGSYAADAAREVEGVGDLVESHLPLRKGVRVVTGDDGRTAVELHLALRWGASAPDVGRDVQARVREYLTRMADLEPAVVDVVFTEIR
jgi:uncharacterized alkaline shock family protein YloU